MFVFRKIVPEDLPTIFNWRRSTAISQFMLSEISDDFSKHVKWYKSVVQSSRPTNYWIIDVNQKSIGVINIEQISADGTSASWGFYIGEPSYNLSGAMIPPFFYNYLFYERFPALQTIFAEVISDNTAILKIHKFHGYESIGTEMKLSTSRKMNVELIKMALRRETWELKAEKMAKFTSSFEK